MIEQTTCACTVVFIRRVIVLLAYRKFPIQGGKKLLFVYRAWKEPGLPARSIKAVLELVWSFPLTDWHGGSKPIQNTLW